MKGIQDWKRKSKMVFIHRWHNHLCWNSDKDEKKIKASFIASRNVKQYSLFEKQFESFLKLKINVPIIQQFHSQVST